MQVLTAPRKTRHAPTPARHLNTFDFLRLVAATIVVVEHATHFIGASWSGSGFMAGADGVAMFFVMSGMLVWRSGERSIERTGGWHEYFRNRFLRIAPALWAYTLVAAGLLAITGAVAVKALASKGVAAWVLGTLFFVPDYDPSAFDHFGTGKLNTALYTIPAEVSFYVAVPVLYWLARRIGFNRMLALLTPVAVLAPVVATRGGGVEKLLTHTFLDQLAYFAAGVLWARYWTKAPKHVGLFVAALAAFVALKLWLPHDVAHYARPAFYCLPLSYAVVWFGYQGPVLLAAFVKRVGDLSFGTYLWHLPIINFFVWKGWTGHGYEVLAVIGSSWAFAWVSWHLVERRALARKRVSERVAETGRLLPD